MNLCLPPYPTGSPSVTEIAEILEHVAKKERVNLPGELAARIANDSSRNLRRAILMFEACRVQQPHLSADQEVQLCEWEIYIDGTASKILREQTANCLLEVRGRLYELLTHCIPPDVILKVMPSPAPPEATP